MAIHKVQNLVVSVDLKSGNYEVAVETAGKTFGTRMSTVPAAELAALYKQAAAAEYDDEKNLLHFRMGPGVVRAGRMDG